MAHGKSGRGKKSALRFPDFHDRAPLFPEQPVRVVAGSTERLQSRRWCARLGVIHLHPSPDYAIHVELDECPALKSKEFVAKDWISLDVFRPKDVIAHLYDAH